MEGAHPVAGPFHLRGAEVGFAVEELPGQVLRFHLVVVEQGEPADAKAGQALQHVGAEPAGAQLQHVGIAYPLLEVRLIGLQPRVQLEEGQVAEVAPGPLAIDGAVHVAQHPQSVERGQRVGEFVGTDRRAVRAEPGPQLPRAAGVVAQHRQQPLDLAVGVVELHRAAGIADHVQGGAGAFPGTGFQADPHRIPPCWLHRERKGGQPHGPAAAVHLTSSGVRPLRGLHRFHRTDDDLHQSHLPRTSGLCPPITKSQW